MVTLKMEEVKACSCIKLFNLIIICHIHVQFLISYYVEYKKVIKYNQKKISETDWKLRNMDLKIIMIVTLKSNGNVRHSAGSGG